MASSAWVQLGDLANLRNRSAALWARLVTPTTRLLQIGWVLLQFGAIAVTIAATPHLQRQFQQPCLDQICDLLPQPSPESIQVLDRLGMSINTYAWVMIGVEWVHIIPWVVLGAIIVFKQPRNPVGFIAAYGGAIAAYSTFLKAFPEVYPAVDVPSQVALVVNAITGPLFFALFPDGRWVPRWTRWVVLLAFGYAVALGITGSPTPRWLEVLDFPLAVMPWVILVGAQIYRYRRVSGVVQRLQMKWLVFGVAVYVANIVIVSVVWEWGYAGRYQFLFLPGCYLGFAAMGIAIGFGILRYRLFEIDAVINRVLIYVGLTASVIGLYALIVGGIGTLVGWRGDPVLALVGAGVVAVLFGPLHVRLRRAVNRIVYGERDEPYAVVARLGQRLESSLAPDAMLTTIVETVTGALKLPYAAIALLRGEDAVVAAEYGTPPVYAPIVVPLAYQGEAIGEMRLAPRVGEHSLSRADHRLLQDLARQAGIAIHAGRLARDLQHARERLVTTREEERRRLRRDLHDGLGPTLGSQPLTVDAARTLIQTNPTAADSLLVDLKHQMQSAIADVRRLVYGLRPPALDDVGLIAALRQEAVTVSRGGLQVEVIAPEPLPSLPAAVEVAAYRIMLEALTNVVRHARASRCTMRFTLSENPPKLRLEVEDDGHGLPEGYKGGIGTASMRERAEELGGTCTITARPDGGVLVLAHLPLPLTGLAGEEDR